MTKNGTKAGIREVYILIQEIRRELNERIDNLENNHLNNLADRITALEVRVWMGVGAVTAITLLLQFLK